MKMRSRLLILKLAGLARSRQIVLTFAAQLTTRKTTMKFPGKRKSKHYFPVNARIRCFSSSSQKTKPAPPG